ncbi:MAG: hypothetical protein EOP48_31700, partial [Sphingobacteriales bacterium]
MAKYLLIIFVVCAFFTRVHAQSGKQPVTVNVTNATLSQFALAVEKGTAYKFYFDEKETDSLL